MMQLPQRRWALIRLLSGPNGQVWLRGAIGGVIVLGLVGVVLVGANRPADPRLLRVPAPDSVSVAAPSRVAGFDQIAFRVTPARAGVSDHVGCALLADTPLRQEHGLAERRDLAGYDAMVFQFASNTTAPFSNHGVPVPISIAWFDGAGVYVGRADLPVCDHSCPTVVPSQAFRFAVEVLTGGLARLGVGQGAALILGGNCG